MPYTRFFSLLLQDMMGENYNLEDKPLASPQVGSSLFKNIKVDTNGGRQTKAMMAVVRSHSPISSYSSHTHSSGNADPEVSVSHHEDAEDRTQREETSSPWN